LKATFLLKITAKKMWSTSTPTPIIMLTRNQVSKENNGSPSKTKMTIDKTMETKA
jgi:hypothetical protein